MAVFLATARLLMLDPEVRVSVVRVVDVETDWTPDPEADAIACWNTA
ncbi:hypothetical protein PO878_11465 [Iamia majanohamensis]|uniref:Uncharacterized protein n=1 Tax=Iamia majanohamensis TaxID=467976 RepID=A0AAE9Y4R2_9ACTN|nr:hypothetical protein [Iamia majanohamensis]WCO65116.1 hypothetical protein PO878_11465 [Iamia majanohamensis]